MTRTPASVLLLSLGGTIAMTSATGAGGAVPTLTAEDLVGTCQTCQRLNKARTVGRLRPATAKEGSAWPWSATALAAR